MRSYLFTIDHPVMMSITAIKDPNYGYGSLGPSGISYPEMEYRYAMETGKPIISFLHNSPEEIPANKTEQEKEGREKLQAFRSFVSDKLVRFWTSPHDLGSIVSRSIIKLIKSNPAIGWLG